MKTATFVKQLTENFRGDARLYKLSEPLREDDKWWSDGRGNRAEARYDYVVVSAANVFDDGPETYIFGADKDGKILSWAELSGSFRGAFDHVRALRDAGYEIVD